MDNASVNWGTSGDALWFEQTAVSQHYGGDAVQSGVISHSESSSLSTSITGPGTLSFYWRKDLESGYNNLTLSINGVLYTLAQNNTWGHLSIPVLPGTQIITWTYSKDDSVTSEQDAGRLDHVVYTPD